MNKIFRRKIDTRGEKAKKTAIKINFIIDIFKVRINTGENSEIKIIYGHSLEAEIFMESEFWKDIYV